jgi:hypothetical protein
MGIAGASGLCVHGMIHEPASAYFSSRPLSGAGNSFHVSW